MPRSASIADRAPPGPTATVLPHSLTHLCFAAVLAIAAVPLLVTEFPPLFDYPNHLARGYMLQQWGQSPAFQAHFSADSFVLPNVLSDVFLLVASGLVGASLAGKLLLLLTMALTLGGVYVLNRAACGRFCLWPLFAAALLYNEMFFWGFLNYNLGLALVPWGLAGWMHFVDRPRLRLAIGILASLIIFFAHLVAFGLYAVAVATLEIWYSWRVNGPALLPALRRIGMAAAQFLPTAAIYVLASPSHDLALGPYFDFSLWAKLSPFARLLSSGNPASDVALLVILVALTIFGLAAARLRFEGSLFAVAAVFLAFALLLPFGAKGSYFLDSRIPIAIALVLAAAACPAPRAPAVPLAGAVVLIALVASRSYVLAQDWRAQEAMYRPMIKAFESLPPGSVVIPASAYEFELGDWVATRRIKPAYEHVAGYAVITRHAVVTNVFARRGQNPLVYAPAVDAMKPLGANPITRVLEEKQLLDLVEQASLVAQNRTTVSPTIPGVYVMVFHLSCDQWPGLLDVHPAACGDDFSLVEVPATAMARIHERDSLAQASVGTAPPQTTLGAP